MTVSTARRRGAAALGVVTVLPLVLAIGGVAGFALDWLTATAGSAGMSGFVVWAMAILASAVLSLCLVAFYAVDAARNPALGGERRAIWILVLFGGNALVFPAYWYAYWWRPARAA